MPTVGIALARLQSTPLTVFLLRNIQLRARLVDSRSKIVGIAPEGDFQLLEEHVKTGDQLLRLVCCRFDGWNARVCHYAICQVRRHNKIVLNNKSSSFSVQDETLDHLQT